jgi:ATP-dependent DNA helicase RecQ
MAQVNLSKSRIEKTIDLLSLESPAPVAKQASKWQLTAARLNDAFWERADRLTKIRQSEQAQMQEYVRLQFGDHMTFLVNALDGDTSAVRPPTMRPLPSTVDSALVRDAQAFLRRTSLPIEPRKAWPGGGMPRLGVKGTIPVELRSQAGRALCVWGDAGWGGLVKAGKYRDNRFSDELVEASVAMIQQWNPQPQPTWVTCIPSLRHPDLVPEFARRLAAALGLPFDDVLVKTDTRPEQKGMANSTQQARNVDGSLAIRGDVPTGPVLLVDDMVDSRWTLTVGAWLLRNHGSGEVWPLALSQTGQDQ